MKSRKKYEKDYKISSVNLAKKSKKPVSEVEDELGIPRGFLSRWMKEFDSKNDDSFPGNGRVTGKDLEILNLKKENKILKEDREILKKAMGIFSGIPRWNTYL